jgi:diguanylate cyclase (GGDEF)-like protein
MTGDGERISVEIHASYLALDGEEFIIAYARDITDQVRSEGMLALQHDVLAGIAAGHSLSQTLDLLTRRVEALTEGPRCTILLLEDGHLYNGASPSVPSEFTKSINGLAIGPDVGCCGAAAYLGETVETVDIAQDPHWKSARDAAEAAGLRACWSTPIHARDGRVLGTFALYYGEPRSVGEYDRRVVESVTHLAGIAIEHHATESRIHALAFFDPLTGLPNRSLLVDRVELALARAEREGSSVALLFIDLDRFKTINDSLGHAVGDRFLCAISSRLEEVVRDCDTVCRQGGDEFVVMLPDCDATGAALVAEKLIASVMETVTIDKHRLSGSASVGISLYPDDAKDYDDLLKHADTAMYRAKEAGRNGYRFYRTKMNEETAERLEVENELRQALQRGDLSLYYQPQVHIGDGGIYGLEALLRWSHATWGMVSPARFIPVAEDSGLIDAIGAWVLDEACRQMNEWQETGVPVPRIAINLSARQFRHEDVPTLVADALWKHGVEPTRLTLEITESLMMHDESTLAALTALDEMGVTLAVDDFGTGYSSLGYLKRFPVSELKLDQTFVRDLGEDEEDCALASAVVRIVQSLRLTVVAEGVETAEQLSFLRDEGCHVAQGYYFARPMPAAELVRWLQVYQPKIAA